MPTTGGSLTTGGAKHHRKPKPKTKTASTAPKKTGSPKRTTPKKTRSPKRTTPKRTTPKKTGSPKRTTPKRATPKRIIPKSAFGGALGGALGGRATNRSHVLPTSFRQPTLRALQLRAKMMGIAISKDGKRKSKASLSRAIAYRK